MGANAQTTVPTFTAGQVLTADQQNQSARTGVPVFATTVERDAAFGGTGEKTLAEGQLCYLESTNVVQYYDGAAWATVGPQTLSSGLTLISTTTIGTTVSSVTVSSAFSSTYDNYRIIVSGGVASGDTNCALTLGATSTGYYLFSIYGTYAGTTVTGANVANGSGWANATRNSTNSLDGVIDLIGPNLAKNTHVHLSVAASATGGTVLWGSGYLADTTQYTAFTLTTASGTLTGGTVKVYGYQNS